MSGIEKVKEFLGSDFEKYRQTLSLAISSEEPYLQAINTYVLGMRGKEIRPVLSLLAGRCCGTLTPASFYCAAASEMLHTATLMHDDVADAASMRRGMLSVAAMFSPAAAVLTGDFWLSRSLHLLTTYCPPAIIECFAESVRRMSEGELLQMDKADKLDTTETDYYKIIYGKTAALFVASIKSAAMAVNANEKQTEALVGYAENLGLAFQIRDDIFDYSPDLKTGKSSGADIKERKITLPLIGALANAPQKAEGIISRIGQIESVFAEKISDKEAEIIAETTAFVRENGGIEHAQQKLEEHVRKAVDFLSVLPECEERSILASVAEYVGKRLK